MTSLDETQVLPTPVWEDPRVHLLDDIWLLTLFVITLAVGVPWFVSSLDVEIGAALLGLLALAAIHVAFTALAAHVHALTPWRRRGLGALHAAGVVLVAVIWHYAGGLQNPMFLLVFALPVTAAIFLSRWQPYFMAAVAALAVASVALIEAPELRWYASGLNATGGWLAAALASLGSGLKAPFPGFYAPTGYFVLLLEVFTVLVFACAVAAEYVGTVVDRLYAHVTSARAEAERAQELWLGLIEGLPVPALLVDANTLQIVCASDTLEPTFCASGAPPAVGAGLLETICFSYPEIIQELVTGIGGSARNVVVRVGADLQVTQVHVQHVSHHGRRFALVLIESATEEFYLRSTLDAAEQAILIIDSNARILALNKPALSLFPNARVGADACAVLAQPDAAPRWWEQGLVGRRKMQLRILPRIFQVTSSVVALPGEEERIHIVAFLPVARADSLDPAQTGLTLTRSPAVHR
jgi:hypothetical protein